MALHKTSYGRMATGACPACMRPCRRPLQLPVCDVFPSPFLPSSAHGPPYFPARLPVHSMLLSLLSWARPTSMVLRDRLAELAFPVRRARTEQCRMISRFAAMPAWCPRTVDSHILAAGMSTCDAMGLRTLSSLWADCAVWTWVVA